MQINYDFAIILNLVSIFYPHFSQRGSIMKNSSFNLRLLILGHAIYLEVLPLECGPRLNCQTNRIDFFLNHLRLTQQRGILDAFLLVSGDLGLVLGPGVNSELRMEKLYRILALGLELVVIGLADAHGLDFGDVLEDVLSPFDRLLPLAFAKRQLNIFHPELLLTCILNQGIGGYILFCLKRALIVGHSFLLACKILIPLGLTVYMSFLLLNLQHHFPQSFHLHDRVLGQRLGSKNVLEFIYHQSERTSSVFFVDSLFLEQVEIIVVSCYQSLVKFVSFEELSKKIVFIVLSHEKIATKAVKIEVQTTKRIESFLDVVKVSKQQLEYLLSPGILLKEVILTVGQTPFQDCYDQSLENCSSIDFFLGFKFIRSSFTTTFFSSEKVSSHFLQLSSPIFLAPFFELMQNLRKESCVILMMSMSIRDSQYFLMACQISRRERRKYEQGGDSGDSLCLALQRCIISRSLQVKR